MRIVALSDTHGKHRQVDLPGGDVLIHAGDFCTRGGAEEAFDFVNWLQDQSFEHKIIVAGNHEHCLEPGHPHRYAVRDAIENAAIYLEDESCTVAGRAIYGSPRTTVFRNWAFMNDEDTLREYFDRIPEQSDILVTHGPPRGILDEIPTGDTDRPRIPRVRARNKYEKTVGRFKHVGSEALREAVDRVGPDDHIFGHIHESYGRTDENGTTFLNCSVLDGDYNFTNDPVVIER